jgi:hypothetical protein
MIGLVILSEAKNLRFFPEMFRFAQHDKAGNAKQDLTRIKGKETHANHRC